MACFPQDIELFLPTQSGSNSPTSQTSAPTGSSRPGLGLCGCREKPPEDRSVLWLPILDRPQSPGAGTCRRDCAGWSRSSPAWAGTCKTQQRLIVGGPQEDFSVPPKPPPSSPVAPEGPSSPDTLAIPLGSPSIPVPPGPAAPCPPSPSAATARTVRSCPQAPVGRS